jgi:hypothetical protein
LGYRDVAVDQVFAGWLDVGWGVEPLDAVAAEWVGAGVLLAPPPEGIRAPEGIEVAMPK